jgi:outer membrane lipoprotein-sorting protein
MAAVKLALASAALIALAVASPATDQKEQAAKMLMRSMQREFPVNVISIITQRDPKSDNSFQRVKVERTRDGLQRCTILQPLRMQGVTSIDDGARMKIYLPDKKIVLDQESPGKAGVDIEDRMKIVRKNYSFSMSDGGQIAGRSTVCVTATPRFDELEIRRYYLDRSTAYPLRLETHLSGKEITVVFDTKDIQFPKTLDRSLFKLATVGQVKTIRYTRPTRVSSAVQAKTLVGFTPLVPKGLPLGFEVQEVQFSDNSDSKAIVVRLSDGLARASVYQTKSGEKLTSDEDSTIFDYKGVRLMLVSDLPKSIREQLLRSFISKSVSEDGDRAQRIYGSISPLESGLMACLELAGGAWAFTDIEQSTDCSDAEGF